MKKYLLMTTATSAAMALTTPAVADSYLRIFGGFGLFSDQNLSIDSISSITTSGSVSTTTGGVTSMTMALFSTMFSYDAGDIPTSPTTGFAPAYPGVYRSTVPITGATTTYRSLNSYRSLVFNYQASGAYTTHLNADIAVDSGFVVGAAVGLDLGNGLSFELEAAYRRASGDAVFDFKSYRRIYGTASYALYVGASYHVTATYTTTPTLMTSMGTLTLPPVIHATSSRTATTARTSMGTNTTSGTMVVTMTTPIANTGSASYTFAESGDITSFAVMANVWWDFTPKKKFHPYVGFGLGWANVELDFPSLTVNDSAIAFQVGAGIGFDVSDNIRVNLEYRYFALPQIEMLSPSGLDMDLEYNVSEFLVGFRYSF